MLINETSWISVYISIQLIRYVDMFTLKTPNHTFQVVKRKPRVNQNYYTIQNLVHSSRICMEVLVWKNDKEWWASIEYLEYDNACSSKNLERKTGTIEMVQGMLTALLKKHPKISNIELSDKSFFIVGKNDRIPLPEYRMITAGATWYEEYFKAIPATNSLAQKHLLYLKERKQLLQKMSNITKLTSITFKEFLRSNDLRQLSGNLWFIPVDAIRDYPIQGVFEKNKEILKGGDQIPFHRQEFDFNLYD